MYFDLGAGVVHHDPGVTVVCAPTTFVQVTFDSPPRPSARKPVEQVGVRASRSECAVCRQSVFQSDSVCCTHPTIVACATHVVPGGVSRVLMNAGEGSGSSVSAAGGETQRLDMSVRVSSVLCSAVAVGRRRS